MNVPLDFMGSIDTVGFRVLTGLLSIIWQSSILFCAVFCLIWVLRRRQASVRHRLLALAILTVPLLPMLSWVAGEVGTPRIPIQVVPSYMEPGTEVTYRVQTDTYPADVPPSAQYENNLPSHPVQTGRPVDAEKAGDASAVFSSEAPERTVERLSSSPGDSGRRSFYPWAFVLVIYVAGVLVFLLPVPFYWVRVRRWLLDGSVSMDMKVLNTFRRARSHLGIGKDFIVVESDEIMGPLTTGTVHPKVLLPARFAESISATELYAVALHEMAHVKRNDTLVNTLISFIRALLFFHPLVWIASRQVNVLAEHACDDVVLNGIGDPLTYAKMLARLADQLPDKALRTELATGFVFSKSAFLRRAEAILSDNREQIQKMSRLTLTGMACAAALSLFSAIALPLGEKAGAEMDVSGMVVFDGKPVGRADVYLQTYDERYHPEFETVSKVGTTGSDGRFSFTIDPDILNVAYMSLRPTVVVFSEFNAVGWEILSADRDLKALTIRLGQLDGIAGVVKSADGRPVKDARVDVRSITDMSRGSTEYYVTSARMLIPDLRCTTNTGGRFLISNIPKGSNTSVVVRSPGYATGYLWEVPAGTDTTVCVLVPEGRIRGRVTFGDTGKPAKGALVTLSGWAHLSAQTDGDGRYVIEGVPKTDRYPYTVTVYCDEGDGWITTPRKNVVVKEGETLDGVDFVLTKGGLVTGRVVDDVTGSGIPGHTVRASFSDDNFRSTVAFAKTDASGSYRLRVPAGSITVRCNAPYGYESARRDRILDIRENALYEGNDFLFSPGVALTGTVLSPEGEPVEGVLVLKQMNRDIESDMPWTVFSDGKGRFTLRGLTEGTTVYVKAEHKRLQYRGEAHIEVSPGAEPVIRLIRYETKSVEGRIIDENGTPLPGVTVDVILNDHETGFGRSAGSTMTDKNGAYRIDGLVTGYEYRATAKAPGYADTEVPLPSLAPPEEPKSGDVTPSPVPRETTPSEIMMMKADRWMEGVVTDEDGVPVEGVRIYINGGPSGFKGASSDNQGRFRIESLVPLVERYVTVDWTNMGSYQFRFVDTNREQHFTLLKKKYFIEGRVVDEEHKPLENAQVYVSEQRHQSGFMYMRVMTDVNGKFRMDPVVDKELDLSVFYPDKGFKTFEKVATNRTDTVLVFDKPDERQKNTWEYNPRGMVLLEGKPSPELNIERWVTGEPVRIRDLKGKIVVLNFFLTSMWAARDWLRLTSAITREYGDDGVVVIGIHECTDDAEAVRRILDEYGVNYRVAIDRKSAQEGSKGKTFDRFGYFKTMDLANYIIIDRDGLVHQDIGTYNIDLTIRKMLKRGVKR